MKSWLVVC